MLKQSIKEVTLDFLLFIFSQATQNIINAKKSLNVTCITVAMVM